MRDYTNRLEKLKLRRQDTLTKAFSLSESFRKVTYGEATKYALEAMEQIAPEYTQNTYRACEKAQNQLTNGLKECGIGVEYRYQGSVPTNTHIRNYSDIDMLTIHKAFYSLEPPQVPAYPYEGNPIDDLKVLRAKVYRILDTAYPTAVVDGTGSKCVSISGGSLNRKIDIVPANWYDSIKYSETKDEDYRGVHIFDSKNERRILNFPFMHIYWINQKDSQVNGNEKKLIRLLKTLKVDADENIEVSSYDIASLIFRMEDDDLLVPTTGKLRLLNNCNAFLKKVVNDKIFRDSLEVANGTRKIFCSEGANVEEVSKLQKELEGLIADINSELRPLLENIENAYIQYQ